MKQGQDFIQHELDNMNFSNQEISFQMQGTYNQHLYQVQILLSYYWVKNRIPTLVQQKSS